MSKLYVDVTELASWQGKLTGVPRVMDELIRRFALDTDTYFVRWQPQGYTQLTYPFSTNEESKSNQSRFKKLARTVYERSRVVKKAVHTSRNIASLQKSAMTQEYVVLSKNDVLLILADWHGGDPSFRKYLQDNANKGVGLVQFVHDILPIVTPQYSGHSTEMVKTYGSEIYPICKLLLCNSDNTKRDTLKWLQDNKLTAPETCVIRLGDDFATASPKKPTMGIPKNYILCVGTIEARKNHTLLYYTYKLAVQKGCNLPNLVIVGRPGWLAGDILELIKNDPQTHDKFTVLSGIDDNELSWLYDNCQFTIYPSFYEGWGLPIAESIAHGKPVIASNTSSMPEIAGDLIDYFSPASPDECLARILKLADKQYRSKATNNIKKYVPYSWDETYESLRKAIKDLE